MSNTDLELLLEQARGVVPQRGAKARLRSRVLSAAVGGAALTTATHATAAKSATWLLSLWVAGGVAVGSLVIAPLLWSLHETSPAAPATTTTLNVAPALPSAPSLAPTTPPSAAPSVSEQPRVAPTPSQGLMPSIERETALLGEAQRALGSGNARAALNWLDRYDREIGHGGLAEEAAAARAVATCTLSKARAVATLAAFRALYPASPLLPRVQSTCSGGTSHDDFELDSRNPATKIQER